MKGSRIIEEAFPNGAIGLTVPLKPADRLAHYLNDTDENDFAIMATPQYVENVRNGLMRPPNSTYWNRLINELPKPAERNLKDFLKLLSESEITPDARQQPSG